MAANFLNEPEDLKEEHLDDEEELSTLESEDSTDNVEQPEEEDNQLDEQPEQDDIPDKYKGKTMAEIIQMHQEAEKAIGRQGSEVGELRKVVDDFIQANLNKEEQAHAEADEDVSVWDDPDKWLEKKLSSNPKLKELDKVSEQNHQQAVLNKLNTEFPDWQETVYNDTDFADWIRKSEGRMQKFQRASNYSWEDAEDLLSTWADIRDAKKAAKETAKVDTKEQRKKASTGSANSSGEVKSRKVYRRSDIINLMQNDPQRYQELSDEILKAYSEGRVR